MIILTGTRTNLPRLPVDVVVVKPSNISFFIKDYGKKTHNPLIIITIVLLLFVCTVYEDLKKKRNYYAQWSVPFVDATSVAVFYRNMMYYL